MPSPMVCRNVRCSHRIETADDSTTRCPKCQGELMTLPLTADPSATLAIPTPPAETPPDPSGSGDPTPFVDVDFPPIISRFQVRQRLGEGAFGIVYRAYDSQLDREVALKVAKPGTLSTPQRVQRFFREAKSAANLRHPNIVPLFETGRDGDHYFIASAFIPGKTLEHHVEETDEKGLPLPDAVRIARKLGEALGYAHSQGIVHRDVKPANVMIDERGEPLLMDFGLAARAEAGEERLTQEGVAMGTPAYMSPEQGRGETERVGPASDQYSLGCTFHEMLTGRTPFSGPAEVQMFLHRTKDPAGVRSLRREVSRDVETICAKSLEKEPGKRYASCQAFADDLRRWQDGEPIAARRLGAVERFARWCRRNPTVASLALLVVGVTAVGISVTLDRNQQIRAEKGETDKANQKLSGQITETNQANRKLSEQIQITQKALAQVTAEKQRVSENFTVAQLALAEASARESGSTVRARTLLAAIEEPFRNWEWHFLMRKYEGAYATLLGHRSRVVQVAFSPDNRTIASSSPNGQIRVWDAGTGLSLREFKGSGWVPLDYSPSGTEIATASETGEIRLVRVMTGEAVRTFKGPGDVVRKVIWSPDGTRLATIDRERTLHLWDVSSGRLLVEFSTPFGILLDAAFSPDGKGVALVGSGWNKVYRYDLDSRLPLAPLGDHPETVACVAWSPDGSKIATGSDDRNARVWDVRTRKLVAELKGHADHVQAIRFSPDGAWIATGSRDGAIRVWNVDTGALVEVLKGHTGPIHQIAFGPEGERLASASDDGSVKLWTLAPSRNQAILLPLGRVLAVSPDGERVVALPFNPTGPVRDALLVDALPGSPHRSLLLRGHRNVDAAAISTEGNRIATRSSDRIVLWDAATGDRLREIAFESKLPQSPMTLSPDGKWLASSTEPRRVRIWNAETGEVVRTLQAFPEKTEGGFGSVTELHFAPNGKRLLARYGHLVPTIHQWDWENGTLEREFKGHTGDVTSVRYVLDGTRVLSTSTDRTVRLWDARTGEDVAVFRGHTGAVYSAAMSPDGTRIFSGGADRTIRVWERKTGSNVLRIDTPEAVARVVSRSPSGELITESVTGQILRWPQVRGETFPEIPGHRQPIQSLTVSRDGSRLASTSWDQSVRVWDTRTGEKLREFPLDSRREHSVALNADGTRLAAGYGEQIATWDVVTGERLENLPAWPAWAAPLSAEPFVLSPSGDRVWFAHEETPRIQTASLLLSREESAIREANRFPGFDWLAPRVNELARDPNRPAFRFDFRLAAVARASARQRFEAHQYDRAYLGFLYAALIRPKRYELDWPEVLPKPAERD